MHARKDVLKMGFLDFLFRKKDEEEEIKKKNQTLSPVPFKRLLDFIPRSAPAPAETPPLSSYKVQPKDTLWDITQQVNGDPTQWPKLYQENKQIIGNNPDLIFPKQNLNLTPILPKLSPGPRRDLLPSLKRPIQPVVDASSPQPLLTMRPSHGPTTEPQNNPIVGEDLFLTNTFPIRKNDNSLIKGLKGTGNAAISTLSAPGELLRKATIQGGNLLSGNGLQELPKNTYFTKDILPKSASNFLENLEEKHPILGGLTTAAIETAADPTMYIGSKTIGNLITPEAEKGMLKLEDLHKTWRTPEQQALADVQNAYKAPSLRDMKTRQYEEVFSNAKPLATERPISLRPPLRGPLNDAELLAQRQIDAQNAFGGPLNNFKLKKRITPGQRSYEARQTELNDVFKDLPIIPVDAPVTRKTLQEGIDSSMGIGKQIGEYKPPDKWTPLANYKVNKTIAEIESRITEIEQGASSTIKQINNTVDSVAIRKTIKDKGGIKFDNGNADILEEMKVIPNWLRNRNGLPLDQMADELGMTSNQLLEAIASSAKKPKSNTSDMFSLLENDAEYKSLNKTLETLRAELPGKRTLDVLPKLKRREQSLKPEPTPIQPKKLELSGTLPVDNPIQAPIRPNIPLKPRELKPLDSAPLKTPTERILPEPLPLQTWTNRQGIDLGSGGPLPLRSITEESLGSLPKLNPPLKPLASISQNSIKPISNPGQLNPPLKPPTGKLELSPTAPKPILRGGPIKPIEQKLGLGQSEILSEKIRPIPATEPVGTKRLSFPDTVARGEITDPKLAEQIAKTELNYGNITNKDTLEVARKFIQDDKEAALNNISRRTKTRHYTLLCPMLLQRLNPMQLHSS